MYFGCAECIEMGAAMTMTTTTSCVAATLTPSNDRARRAHIFIAVWIVYFVNLIYFIIISVFTFNVSVSIFLSLSVGRSVGWSTVPSDGRFERIKFDFSLRPRLVFVRVYVKNRFSFSSHQSKDDERENVLAQTTHSVHIVPKRDRPIRSTILFHSLHSLNASQFCFPFLLFLYSRNGYYHSSQTHCTSTIFRMHKLFSHNIVWKMNIPRFGFGPFSWVWFRSRLHRVSPRKMEIGGSIFLVVGAAHSDPFWLARRMRRTVNEYVLSNLALLCVQANAIYHILLGALLVDEENYWIFFCGRNVFRDALCAAAAATAHSLRLIFVCLAARIWALW